MKDFHVFRTFASGSESLTVASELTQAHDIEFSVFDTFCDDVSHLVQNFLNVIAGELGLVYTYIEAPKANHGSRSIRSSSKLRNITGSRLCRTANKL